MTASTISTSTVAIKWRIAFVLLTQITALWSFSLISGIRARRFVVPVSIILGIVFLIHTLVFSLTPEVVAIGQIETFWGESLTIQQSKPNGWWVPAIFGVAFAVQFFGIYCGYRLWKRDRVSAVLTMIAIFGTLAIFVAEGAKIFLFLHTPVIGAYPSMIWVCLIALLIARGHRRTREQLDASRQRFRGLFDQTSQFVGLMTTDGTLIEANRTALQFVGADEDDVIGLPFWKTPWWKHSPELQAQVRAAVEAANSGTVSRFEVTHPRSDGHLSHFDFSIKPIRDESGEVTLLLPEGTDITERKQAEATIRHLLEGVGATTGQGFFQALTDHLCRACNVDYAFVGEIDPLTFTTVSSVAASHQGSKVDNFTYELENTPCKNVSEQNFCYHPGDVQRLYPKDELLVQMGIESYMGIPLMSVDGRTLGLIVLLHGQTMPIPEQAETILRVVAARAGAELEREQADAGRRAAEEALREHETFLRLTQEAAHVGSWEWDIAAKKFKWSDELTRMHGISVEDFDGELSTAQSFCHPDDVQRLVDAMSAAVSGTDLRAFECRIIRSDGEIRDLWFLGNIVRSGRRSPGRILGVAIDITERKEAEHKQRELELKLAQAQKMETVGRLAGGVAHDFNNLLTVISGYCGLLKSNSSSEDERSKMLQGIEDASLRASALTRQLLTFSRQQVVEPRIIDLNAVVADVETLLRRLIGEDVVLTTVLTPDLDPINADPGQISQVILNLAVNARDAMPTGGKLTIGTDTLIIDDQMISQYPDAQPGRYVRLTVTDDGVGMTTEVQSRLFEPFFTTKGPGQGTGLGLATVSTIADQSGGFLTVSSEPGRGSSFHLYLPTLDSVEKPVPTIATETTPFGNETILVVEDEDVVRGLILQILAHYGYTIIEAANGDQAISRFEEHKETIDLLITDVVMPEIGGRELAEKFQRTRPDLKVLFLSGYTDDAVVRHGVLEADVAFLQKPFTVDGLATKVRNTIDNIHRTFDN